jgi:phage tail sheath protein FI
VSTYLAPGVYFERADASAPVITAIRTDVAGFVGIAQRGLVDTPIPVESARQFEAHFGGFTGSGFLAYTVRAFFENGGRRCWIVRVASNDPAGGARPASIELPSTVAGRSVWSIQAFSQGVWGNDLTVSIEQTSLAQATAFLDPVHPERLTVSSSVGFQRGTLVRLSQPGVSSVLRVVAGVDATVGFASSSPDAKKFLVWIPDQPALWLPYDYSALPFDPSKPIFAESIEYSVLVEQKRVPIALYTGLTLIPEHPSYGAAVLATFQLPDNFLEQRKLPPPPQPITIVELRPEFQSDSAVAQRPLELPQIAVGPIPLSAGVDGLRLLETYDFIGEPTDPRDSDLIKRLKTRGLRALEAIDEVAILAVPDIQIRPVATPPIEPLPPCVPDPCLPGAPPPIAPSLPPPDVELPPVFSDADIYRVQSAMVEQCERLGDRIALIDPPFDVASDDRLGIGAVQNWRSQFDSRYAAFYFPWMRVVDPLRLAGGVTRDIPPCGHVAGQYADIDFTIGVHKAPANDALSWVQDVTVAVNTAQHGVLNPRGINAIRTLAGRGIRIFGARTVSSDPDWIYVNVRRLMIMIEKAIRISIQWAVFEPNSEITWAKIRLSLISFLLALWQQGKLPGATADAAFFVRCDETTNPPAQRDNGQLVALVGVAPAIPFEFVVVRVGRTENEFELREMRGGMGGN